MRTNDADGRIRCAEFRRYLSPVLDRRCFEATVDTVRASRAGGRVRRLDWDTDFFGVSAGRIDLLWRDDAVPAAVAWNELVPLLLARAVDLEIVFLDIRIAAEELALAQALEAAGFRLVDTMATYLWDLRDQPRGLARPPASDLTAFLRDAFAGMIWGRVYADPHISRERAEEFYRRTTLHYLSQGAVVTVLEEDGVPTATAVGFIDEEASGWSGRRLGVLWLLIVSPEHQGKGIGKRLFNQFRADFAADVDFLEIGTQIQNVAANRIYQSGGHAPVAHALTFHRWAAP